MESFQCIDLGSCVPTLETDIEDGGYFMMAYVKTKNRLIGLCINAFQKDEHGIGFHEGDVGKDALIRAERILGHVFTKPFVLFASLDKFDSFPIEFVLEV